MKPIKLTPQALQAAKQAFNDSLENLRFQGEKLNFTYNFEEDFKKALPENAPKPLVYMSAITYLKMLQYVLQSDKEIAWHGTVSRTDNNFFIKDVFLYPQRTTGVTVQTDDTKYTQWAEKLSDETFNTMRFQGHSHVNMTTGPSGTDLANWNEFLQNLLDTDFYIFAIMNKSQDLNIYIYDLANNLIFERADISFKVYLSKELEITSIRTDMKTYIEEPVTVYSNYDKTPNMYDKYRNLEDEDYYSSHYADAHEKHPVGFKLPIPSAKEKNNIKIKRHVVIMDRNNRNFEKCYPEYEGERINVKQNGTNYEVFIPYTQFDAFDIQALRLDNWHVREMQVPEEYNT